MLYFTVGHVPYEVVGSVKGLTERHIQRSRPALYVSLNSVSKVQIVR